MGKWHTTDRKNGVTIDAGKEHIIGEEEIDIFLSLWYTLSSTSPIGSMFCYHKHRSDHFVMITIEIASDLQQGKGLTQV